MKSNLYPIVRCIVIDNNLLPTEKYEFFKVLFIFVGLEYGRIFDYTHDLVMMMTILLPGTYEFCKILLLIRSGFISKEF